MPLFAVAAIDQVKNLTPDTWMKIGIAVAALIVAVFIVRKLGDMNKVVAGAIVFVVGTVVFFSWVYNRNEPKFLSPLVEHIAPFFPSANTAPAKTTPKATPKPAQKPAERKS